ncbi:MAG: DUF2141 domain-containing protein [Myxococcota bacterium]
MTRAAAGFVATGLMVAALTAGADERSAGRLMVVVTHVESGDGKVYCALFDRPEGFPSDPDRALRGLSRRAREGRVVCPFGPVPAGTYAVAVIHDEDDDGELDTGLVGRPLEPWGVSNNPRGPVFGPPSFEDAAFAHPARPQRIVIRLR